MELKEIKREIGAVRNIRELTAALETLSALKMKKAQKIALLSRPFAQKVAALLEMIEPNIKEADSVFFNSGGSPEKQAPGPSKILALVLTSDRGFCGSFNQNVLKLAEKEIKKMSEEGEVELFPVGKKGHSYFKKGQRKISFHFFGIGDYGELAEIKPVSDFLVKSFLENKFQKIYLIFTDFVSTFIQKPKAVQLLPLKREVLEEILSSFGGRKIIKEKKIDFLIEPSRKTLIDEIIPQMVEYVIYQCVLEANAAEHSARMMAMRNASDNAQKRWNDLQLEYNKARQEQITSEVCEISSTKEVLE